MAFLLGCFQKKFDLEGHQGHQKVCSLPVLTWLCLAQNVIHTLTIDTWRGLTKLMALQMNSIHTIEPFSFSQLNNLRTLNLSHTRLTRIGQTLFYGLDSLVTLDLSHTPIAELHGESLVGMKASLVSLHIVTKSVGPQYKLLVDIMISLSSLENLYVYPATFCRYMSANITCHYIFPVEYRCCKLIRNFATEFFIWFFGACLWLFHFVAGSFWIYTKSKSLLKLLLILPSVYSTGLALYLLYILLIHYYYGSYFLFSISHVLYKPYIATYWKSFPLV